MTVTEDHYSSGEYWTNQSEPSSDFSSSDFKVSLALRALSAAKVTLRPGLRAAEVGCGNGRFLFPLAKILDASIEEFKLTGFDIAANAIEWGKQEAERIGDSRISFTLGSPGTSDGQFDVLFLMDVVEHVTDPYGFLFSLRGVAPVIVLHIPIEQSLAHSVLSKPRESYRTYHHVHFFSMETLKILLEETGYDVEYIQFTAASEEILHTKRELKKKVLQMARYCAYKVAPRLSSLLMGGSVMVILRPVPSIGR